MRQLPRLLLAVSTLGAVLWLALSGAAQDAAQPGGPGVGRFTGLSVQQDGSVPSALDIRLDGKGKAVRLFSPESKDPRTYFNDAGMLYTNGWVVISGTMSGKGEGYNIEVPTKDPSMLAIWSDILGPAIQVRAANAGAESYIFQALDREGDYTFSVEQDGSLRWGSASRAAMDTRLYRSAAGTLKTDGSLVVGGSQTVKRTSVRADYTVGDADYYIGVADTSARRTITLPSAKGREGRVYVIKDESGGAGTHPIAVKAGAGETIDGAGAMTIGTSYGVQRVTSSGENWFGM